MSDRYYYDYRGGGSVKKKGLRTWDFLFPFLFLIVIGLILIFGFKLFYFFYGEGTEKSVYLYLVNGQAQVKMWGTDNFVKAYSGTKILQGDEVVTSKDSVVVAKFFEGTTVRFSGDTDVVFNDVYSDEKATDVQLILNKGEIWVNKTAEGSFNTNLFVRAGNLSISPTGTVFDVENRNKVQSVRVMYGNVGIDVFSQDGGTSVDRIDVEAQKEASFNEESIQKFWQFQAPNVVQDLSEKFKATSWCIWNIGEDEKPTDFAAVTVQKIVPASSVEPVAVPIAELQVIVPATVFSVQQLSTFVQTVVNQVKKQEEVLHPSTIQPPAATPVLNLGPLTIPKILTVNGAKADPAMAETGITVDTSKVKVIGEVQGADKVFVNNYQLQKFVPKEGKETFTYYANADSTNLKKGLNTYEIYASSPDGKISTKIFLKIDYEPKEEAPAAITPDRAASTTVPAVTPATPSD